MEMGFTGSGKIDPSEEERALKSLRENATFDSVPQGRMKIRALAPEILSGAATTDEFPLEAKLLMRDQLSALAAAETRKKLRRESPSPIIRPLHSQLRPTFNSISRA